MEGLRKNQNPRTGLSPDLSPVDVLKTASIVVQTINVESAQLIGKIVRHVVKESFCQKVSL